MTFLKHQHFLQFFLPMIQHCNFLQSLHDLYDLANFELSKIEDWFKANKLTLNASKTKYILFKNKKRRCITSLILQIDNKDKDKVMNTYKLKRFIFASSSYYFYSFIIYLKFKQGDTYIFFFIFKENIFGFRRIQSQFVCFKPIFYFRELKICQIK